MGLTIYKPLEECATMLFRAQEDYLEGDFVLINDTPGVVIDDTKAGEDGVLIYECQLIALPKRKSDTYEPGQRISFDKQFNRVLAHYWEDGIPCGVVIHRAVAGDETVACHLKLM